MQTKTTHSTHLRDPNRIGIPIILNAPCAVKIPAPFNLVEDRITRPGVEGFISGHSLRVSSAISLA